MKNCILANMWYVPRERLVNIELIKREMQVTPIWFNRQEPPPKPIQQCDFSDKDYVGFPIAYGMKHYPDKNFKDHTSKGGVLIARKRPDPNHEMAVKGQAKFMKDIQKHFIADDNPVGLAIAGTGTGKTVVGLDFAAEYGRQTLVITDRQFIGFEQWIPSAKEFLGLNDSEIGKVQGQVCEFKGKMLSVAIAKSLLDNDYGDEFYSAFGLILIDEVQTMGAREMSRILTMFNASKQYAMTATDKRLDGCERLYIDTYGDRQIVSTAKTLSCQVKVLNYKDETGGPMPKSLGLMRQRLARDEKRNRLIVAELIKLYNDGRTILVIGDDIQHLQRIEQACWKLGVPEDATGQFSRERYILRGKPGIHKGEKVIIKRQKKARVTDEYLNWVKMYATIIFSTYGMMEKGIDIPRFDAGMDITPRSTATQTIGRVRRPMPGKRKPLWVTIRDSSHPNLVRSFQSRLRDYLDSNVEVLQ